MSATATISIRSSFFSVYARDDGKGQFTAIKAQKALRREDMEWTILRRHNARPIYRINLKLKENAS